MTLTAEHAQSLADFRATVVETLDRVNQTGKAELITVDGEPRGVLLSPAVYGELAREAQLARDVAVIRRSMQQIEAGEYQPLADVSREVREMLLARKDAQAAGATE